MQGLHCGQLLSPARDTEQSAGGQTHVCESPTGLVCVINHIGSFMTHSELKITLHYYSTMFLQVFARDKLGSVALLVKSLPKLTPLLCQAPTSHHHNFETNDAFSISYIYNILL